MDSRQLTCILRSGEYTSKVFRGVYALNRINLCQGPGLYICNTHPSHLPGEHWIAIGIYENNTGEYFDSFGLPPMKEEFLDFLNKNTDDWTYNKQCIQHPLSTVCGHYCLIYGLYYARGLSMSKMLYVFDEDLFNNDIIVHDFVCSTFNVNAPLIDVDMIVNQIGYNMYVYM